MSAVRQKDIADKLGLSMTTVSRALTGKGRVRKETCQKVLELAQELNYTVNSLARSLRLSDTRSIGVVVPDISNSFFASIIKGAQGECHEQSYMLMVCNSDENSDYEEAALKALLEKQVSGIIVASVGGCKKIFDRYDKKNTPVVYIDNVPYDTEKYDLVSIDNFSAALSLTRAVIDKGYTDIGIIIGPRVQSSSRLRLEGYMKALEERGIEIREEWVREGKFSLESGYFEMKQVLHAQKKPSAMFFASNKLAYGAIKAILDEGMSIPKDIAVVSFDAFDSTGLVRPQIVSMNQPAEEIGKTACRMILEKLSEENHTGEGRVFLEPYFTDGDSW